MPLAELTAEIETDQLQVGLTASRTSLQALGITVAPTSGIDCPRWDPETATLRIPADLDDVDELAVLVDMWTTIVFGAHTSQLAHIRPHLTVVGGKPRVRRSRRAHRVVSALAPIMLAAACLYPVVAHAAVTSDVYAATIGISAPDRVQKPRTPTTSAPPSHPRRAVTETSAPIPRRIRRRQFPVGVDAVDVGSLIATGAARTDKN